MRSGAAEFSGFSGNFGGIFGVLGLVGYRDIAPSSRDARGAELGLPQNLRDPQAPLREIPARPGVKTHR